MTVGPRVKPVTCASTENWSSTPVMASIIASLALLRVTAGGPDDSRSPAGRWYPAPAAAGAAMSSRAVTGADPTGTTAAHATGAVDHHLPRVIRRHWAGTIVRSGGTPIGRGDPLRPFHPGGVIGQACGGSVSGPAAPQLPCTSEHLPNRSAGEQ